MLDKAESASIAEGNRIEFFEGKRKQKDGTWKKTGHQYWQWVKWKTLDTGKRERVRPYGGGIETVPSLYRERARKYQASITSRSPESLADTVLRPTLARVQSWDTGNG